MGGYNGNGVYVRYYNWQNDANSNIPIRSDRMDTEDNGFATALSNVITRDGQTTITANIPMANFRFLNVADAQNKQEFITVNQIMNGYATYPATVGGTANAITLGFSPGFTAYTTGMKTSFVATNSNTGAVTVSIDALPTKAITKNGSTALVTGDIIAGTMYTIQYDGTEFQLINPSLTTSLGSYVLKVGDTMTGALNFTTAPVNEAKGTDIASAATTNIGAANGNYVNVTGTTTITAFDTVQAGIRRIVNFTGILTLTYNAVSLILPGLANIATAAGDTATFVSLGSGNWKCTEYNRANGQALTPSAFLGALNYNNMIHVQEQQTQGTDAGSSSTGIQARTPNTVINNTISGASLSAGVITLPAGTYYIEASAPCYSGNQHKTRLFNNTDSVYALEGNSEAASSVNAMTTTSFLYGFVTIASSKAFILRHYITTTQATKGLGQAVGSGIEVYSQLKAWKVA